MMLLLLKCGKKYRTVEDLHINFNKPTTAYVNGGRDDLYDLGFGVKELKEYGLRIEVLETVYGWYGKDIMVLTVDLEGKEAFAKFQGEPGITAKSKCREWARLRRLKIIKGIINHERNS